MVFIKIEDTYHKVIACDKSDKIDEIILVLSNDLKRIIKFAPGAMRMEFVRNITNHMVRTSEHLWL